MTPIAVETQARHLTPQSKDERFYSTKQPDGRWDDIVIGSGMGGMTTAAMLAKLGRRVLILEQHYVPGGFTHTFKRKKWVWDVGVHAVGEVGPQAALGRVLAQLTDGRLSWAPLGDVYDEFHFPDLRIDFPNARPQFVANLKSAFPGEERAIGEYLRLIKEVSGTMRRYYLSRLVPASWAALTDPLLAGPALRLLGERTKDVLDKLTSNEKLKAVLTAQWGYYGVPPARSSFAIHALVAKHFIHGGFYPVGGSGAIAHALLETVAKAGGWTRIRADVAEILVEKGRAAGVRLADGEVIRAERVVSAAGGLPTVKRLLPPSLRAERWAREIAALKPSPCHVCLYIGFKGDIRSAGASAANKWFYETWSPDAVYWDVERGDREAPILYCSFPSLKDPHHDPGPEELHTGEVVTFVPYRVFEAWRDGRWKKRGEEYETFKARLTEQLLDQLCRHMPGLRDKVAFVELSTPLSTEHFTRAALGAIYGIEPTPERYRTRALRPRTPIPGLYLSGSDMASVGVMGAMVGGALAAVAAEPVRAIRWLRESGMR
jgi:all-trans-retinol 13,14-reductase